MVYAVMAALLPRERTGEGQEAQEEMAARSHDCLCHGRAWWRASPLTRRAEAARLPRMLAPDRRCRIRHRRRAYLHPAHSDRHWRWISSMLRAGPDLTADPRLAGRADAASRHVAELYALIADCVRGNTTAHWLAKLKSADIPCGPVNPLAEAPDAAGAARRRSISFPVSGADEGGRIRTVRPPVRFGILPIAPCANPAPRLGEHSREILRERRASAQGGDPGSDCSARSRSPRR